MRSFHGELAIGHSQFAHPVDGVSLLPVIVNLDSSPI